MQLGGVDIGEAFTEQSVTLLLADEIDTSRGDMIVKTDEAPAAVKEIRATVCWLAETPLDRARTYLIRHTTRDSKAKLTGIDHRLDVNTLEKVAADKLAMNDIAEVTSSWPSRCSSTLTWKTAAPGPSSSSTRATTIPSVPG